MAEHDDDRRSEVRSSGSSRCHRDGRGEGGGRGDRGSRRSRRDSSRSRSRSRSRSPDSRDRHRSSHRSSSRRSSKHRRRSSRSDDDDDGSSGSSRSDSRSPTAATKQPSFLPSSSTSSAGVAGVPQIMSMNPYVGGLQQQQAMPVFSAGLVTGGYTLSQQQQQLTPQDKINRELFVGNVPPGTSEALLMQFLNGAMRRVGLCGPTDTPIVNCRTNSKFAFIEITSQQMAAVTLNLNGIPFLGASLRVSRPSKYAGPMTPSQTWQQLTGQPLPPGMTPVPENPSGNVIGPGGVVMTCTPEEKLQRELFVGNTTPEMTESMLKDFLGRALEQVGLTIMPGNPILACRVSGKFAFVELRSKEEAANALNLNNIPYLGAQLRVGRPSKYTGPLTPHGNWEDILAKFMIGELQLGGGGMQMQQQQMQQQIAPAAAAATAYAPFATTAAVTTLVPAIKQPTTVVELKQMLTLKELIDDTEYEEILEDTRDECTPFGTLKNVIIPRTGPGATKIFLEYMAVEDAGRAIAGLAGRTFDGRKVEAVYFDPVKFANQDYSD